MAPGPGQNSPIVIGMTERARRPIVLGNLYVVFYKGYKIVGECTTNFGPDHVVIQAALREEDKEPKLFNFVYARRWVFTFEETNAFLN